MVATCPSKEPWKPPEYASTALATVVAALRHSLSLWHLVSNPAWPPLAAQAATAATAGTTGQMTPVQHCCGTCIVDWVHARNISARALLSLVWAVLVLA